MTYVLATSLAFLLGFLCGSLLAKAAHEEDARTRHPTHRKNTPPS